MQNEYVKSQKQMNYLTTLHEYGKHLLGLMPRMDLFRLGFDVTFGTCVGGNIGNEDRKELTVIGDVVMCCKSRVTFV